MLLQDRLHARTGRVQLTNSQTEKHKRRGDENATEKKRPMRPSTPQEWLTGMETLPRTQSGGERKQLRSAGLRENRAAVDIAPASFAVNKLPHGYIVHGIIFFGVAST